VEEGESDIEPDLEKADLDGLKMGDVPISAEQNRIFNEINGVDLSDSNLTGASFIEAQLIGANFSSAKLRRSDFIRAFLFKADFSCADLEGASLMNATLN